MADSHINKLKRYTVEEDEIIKKYYPGNGWEKVNEILTTRNKDSIQNRAKKLGVKYLSYNSSYFENIDNEVKSYWLGFIYTDGYVTNDGRFGIELSSVDKSHLVKLNEYMDSNIKIKDRIRIKNEVEKYSSSITYKNKKLTSDLIDKGVIPNKTEIMEFPSKELLGDNTNHFIRGLFDGDGTIMYYEYDRIRKDRNNKVYKSVRIEVSFVCKSLKFITELKNVIKNESNVDMKFYESKGLYYLKVQNKKDCLNLLNYLYKDSTVYLDRKYDKYKIVKEYCFA